MAERVPQKEKMTSHLILLQFFNGLFGPSIKWVFFIISIFATFLNASQKRGSFGPISKIVLTLEQTLSELSGLKEPTISRLILFSIF